MNVSVVEKQMCGEYVQTFADLVFILDKNGSILDYKSGNSSIVSLSLDTLLNKKIQDVLHSGKKGGLDRGLHTLSKEELAMPLEFSLPVAGKQHWFDARLTSNPPRNTSSAPGILLNTKNRKYGCRPS